MTTDLNEIWIGAERGFSEFTDDSNELVSSIPGVSRINLILGKNDSRKSRFLRELIKLDDLIIFPVELKLPILKARNCLTKIREEVKSKSSSDVIWKNQYLGNFTVYNFPEFEAEKVVLTTNDMNTLSLDRYSTVLEEGLSYQSAGGELINIESLSYLIQYIQYHILYFKYRLARDINYNLHSFVFEKLLETEGYIKEVRKMLEGVNVSISPDKIFIPSLRMTRNVFDQTYQNENILKEDLQTKYSILETEKIKIYDGLNLFNEVKRLRNSILSERKKIESFERFLSETFFDGQRVDLVADLEKLNIRLYIEGGDDRVLFNRGDGIQNIIMLLYPIFTCQDESWLFIEEPELNMHPGMQSLFMRTILSHEAIKKKNLRFFIVTHSNHLLDVGADANEVSFYTLTNKGKTSILTNQLSPNNNVLRELGVFNSSVVMSNCSIWVEGVSDRLFIKGFLKVYFDTYPQKALVEGYNYSFLEYAGNNLVHYDFTNEVETQNIKSFLLTNRIFLLADHDNGKESKHLKFEELSDNRDFVYETTVSKEIENLVPPKLLKLFLVEKLKANEERVKNHKFRYKDYSNIGFGAYLENLAIELKIHRKSYTQKKSNTGALSPHYKQVLSKFIFDKCTEGKVSWEDIIENGNAETVMNSLVKFLEIHN